MPSGTERMVFEVAVSDSSYAFVRLGALRLSDRASRSCRGCVLRAHEDRVDCNGIAQQPEGLKQRAMVVDFKDGQECR